MVSSGLISDKLFFNQGIIDFHMLRVPGPGLSDTEPRTWVWVVPEQDVDYDGVGVGGDADCAGICAVYADDIPDGGIGSGRFVGDFGLGRGEFAVT